MVRGGNAYPAYHLGMSRYEANDLTEARRELERGWEAAGTFGAGRLFFGAAVAYLPLARLATGARQGAFEAIRAVDLGAAASHVTTRSMLAEVEARLQVMTGDIGAAALWASTSEAASTSGPTKLATGLTIARVSLAQGRPADAGPRLRTARQEATRAGALADLVSVAILEARRADQLGERRTAHRAFEEAIALAAPEWYLRRFIDDGRALRQFLPAVRRVAPSFVDQVLAVLLAEGAAPVARGRARGGPLWQDAQGEAIEALTEHELEVLRLMVLGLPDAAIAEAIGVSLTTTKWHAAHVRAKLGARNRTQALHLAQELGLV